MRSIVNNIAWLHFCRFSSRFSFVLDVWNNTFYELFDDRNCKQKRTTKGKREVAIGRERYVEIVILQSQDFLMFRRADILTEKCIKGREMLEKRQILERRNRINKLIKNIFHWKWKLKE